MEHPTHKRSITKDQKQSRICFNTRILGEENRTQHLAQELDGIFGENLFRLEVGEVTF